MIEVRARSLLALVASAGLALSQGNPVHHGTYLGGSGSVDEVLAVAVAQNGDLIVAGRTDSADFPVTAGAFATTIGGGVDAFVARLSPDCSAVLAATFLGGTAEDRAVFLQVAADGTIWVGGETASSNFPTTSNAFAQHGGSTDAFVARFDQNLTTLLYGTAVGSTGPNRAFSRDTGSGFAIDEQNQVVYVAGTTNRSWSLPPGALQTSPFNFNGDFYVVALDLSQPGATTLSYGTLFGGTSTEFELGTLTHEGNGVVTVSGLTVSTDFPTTSGAVQTQNPSVGPFFDSAVVFRIDTAPQAQVRLLYSTYLGGSNTEDGVRHVTDAAGVIHVIMGTASSDPPFTANAQSTSFGGNSDTYYAQLDPAQSGPANLRYGSYVAAGNRSEYPGSLALSQGRLAVLLVSGSTNLPTTAGAFQESAHGNFRHYLLEFDVGIQPPQLRYASHYGAGVQTLGFLGGALAYDGSEVVIGSAGAAGSGPVTLGAAQLQPVAFEDGFVGRLELRPWPSPFTSFGSSCAGSVGTPQLAGTEPARLCRTLTLTASGLQPGSGGLFLAGFSNTQFNGTPLPFPLASLGAPGCEVLAAPQAILFRISNGGGEASLGINVPLVPELLGAVVFAQYAAVDLPANTLGLVTTNGIAAEVRW